MVPQRPTAGNPLLPHSTTVTAGFAAGTAAATVDPAIAPALGALLGADVGAWTAHGLECIKRRTVRRVFRGSLDGVPVHLKVFRADTLAAKLRASLRRARGEREASHLLAALALGLPAVEPLAYGVALEDGHPCSFVATRTVAAAPFAWSCPPATAAAVGALLRRVHDLGLSLPDLHAGNVLVAGPDEATGSPQLWLCDLTALRRTGEPGVVGRARALAFFCNPIDGGPLDPIARPLLDGYLDAGPALPASFRQQLALATAHLRASALRSFGRRSQRSCRHTEAEPRRRATPRWFWHLGEGIDAALRAACRQFDDTAAAPVRAGRRGAVWLTDALAIKDRDAGAARRLWRAHYWLLFAGVLAPQPVALRLADGRGRVFVRRLPAPTLADELAAGSPDAAAIDTAARTLGDSVGRLHAHGLRQRDLKFENLVRDPTTGAVAIVDLDGIRLHGAADTRGAGRDLGRLLAAFRAADQPGGAATVRAFLRAYLRTRRRLLQRVPMRRLCRRAEQRAGEWAIRHARRP